MVTALEQLALDPTALYSNLLPVNANGDVLFLSVLSMSSSGTCGIPRLYPLLSFSLTMSEELRSCSKASCTCEPRNDEMIAGGASLAPSLWALDADITSAFSRPLWSYTALRVLATIIRNIRFSLSVFPGDISPMPDSVPTDQLQCFPDPLTPA